MHGISNHIDGMFEKFSKTNEELQG